MSDQAQAPAEQVEATTETVRDPQAVLRQNTELLGEVKRLKEIAKKADGFDFDKAHAAMQQLASLEEEKLTKRGEYEKLLEQKQSAWEKRIQEADAKHASLLANLEQERITNFYTSVVGVRAEHADSIPRKFIEALQLESSDEGFRLIKKGGIGDDAELKELGELLRTSKPFLFESTSASGSGAQPSSGGSSAKQWTRSQWDSAAPQDRSAFASSGGVVKD
jgi:hypothetical protein